MDDSQELEVLMNLLVNEHNVFSMTFSEFKEEFPARWRNHHDVRILFDIIQKRKQHTINRVEENVKSTIEQISENLENPVQSEYVLEMMEKLESNLTQDLACLNESTEEVLQLFSRYSEYFEARIAQMNDVERALPEPPSKELQRHMDSLGFVG